MHDRISRVPWTGTLMEVIIFWHEFRGSKKKATDQKNDQQTDEHNSF